MNNVKDFILRNQDKIILIIGGFLICLISFGAGRLSGQSITKEPLRIEQVQEEAEKHLTLSVKEIKNDIVYGQTNPQATVKLNNIRVHPDDQGNFSIKLEKSGELMAYTENEQVSLAVSVLGSVAGESTYEQTKSSPEKSAPEATTSSGKININKANKQQLETLPSIGPALAERIIDYRKTHGSFKNVGDIKNVKGIGDKTFEKFKDLIEI